MANGSRQWGWVALLAVMILWAVTGRTAWGHVNLVTAVPEPGATLTDSPPEVQLTFDGEINQTQSRIALFTEGFQAVPEVMMLPDVGENNQLAAQIPSLDPGRYTVQWAVVSADGHPLRGSYAFALEKSTVFPAFIIPIFAVLMLVIIGAGALYGWRRHVVKAAGA